MKTWMYPYFILSVAFLGLSACGEIKSEILSSKTDLRINDPTPVSFATQNQNVPVTGDCYPDGSTITGVHLVTSVICANGKFTAEFTATTIQEGHNNYPLSLNTPAGKILVIEVPIYKKTIPPSGTLDTSWAPGQTFSPFTAPTSGLIPLLGTCSEDTTAVEILNSEGVQIDTANCLSGSWSSSINVSGRSDGPFQISVNLVDSVGNKTSLASSPATLDQTPPSGSVTTSPFAISDNSTPPRNQAPVAGTCSSDTVSIDIFGDDNTLLKSTTCAGGVFSAQVDLSSYSEDVHTLKVIMKDSAGNPLTQFGPFVTIDTTPPSGAITSIWPSTISPWTTPSISLLPVSGTCSEDTQNIVIKDFSNQTLLTTVCSGTTWSSNLDLSSYADGAVQLKALLSDSVANTLSLNLPSITLDRTPPTGSITATFPPGDVASAHTSPANNAIPLSGTCSADTASITIKTSGGTIIGTPSCTAGAWSITHDFSGIPDGTVSLQAVLSDPWMNTLTLNFAPLTLKTAAPLGVLSFGNLGTTPSNVITTRTVTLNTPADITRVKYYVQYSTTLPLASCISDLAILQTQAPVTTAGSSVDISLPLASGDGYYDICAIGGDSYGNYQTLPATSSTILIDTTTAITLNPLTQNRYQSVVTFSGTCEIGSTITVSGDGVGLPTSFACPAGTFSYPASLSAGEGNKSFTFTGLDPAGNSASASQTVVRDNTIVAPTWKLTARPNTQTMAYFTAGSCGDVTGVLVTEAGGTPSLSDGGWQPCTTAANQYAYDLSLGADGLRTLRAFFRDEAGNISTVVLTSLILDTKPPQITFDAIPAALPVNLSYTFSWQITEANISAAANFSIEYYDGSSWSSIGTTPVGQNGPLSGRRIYYSYVIPNNPGPGKRIRVSITDASGLSTTTTSAAFTAAADSTPPVVTAGTFLVNGSATPPVTYSNVVAISLAAVDTQTDIISYCIRESSTAPANSDSCWVAMETYAVTPALSINTNAIKYNLGLPGAHTLYLFVRDRALNISQLQATPQAGTDYVTINYVSDAPPVLSSIAAANTETPDMPPRWDQLSVGAGDPLYIQWNASDNGAITSVDILASTDGVNFSNVVTNLLPGVNSGCTLQPGFNGCAIVASPYSFGQSFRLQVKVYDDIGQMAVFTSTVFNAGNFRILGGNLDSGDGGDPRKAIFSPPYIESRGSTNQMAVLTSGLILLNDPRGLVVVDPVKAQTYTLLRVSDSATPAGDGGPVSAAFAGAITKFAIDFLDNIWIYDLNRIRKIDTHTDPWTISSVIGATDGGSLGTSTADTVVNPQDFKLSNGIYNTQFSQQMVFAPNGDLYFSDASTSNLIRVYRGSQTNPIIETIRASGTPTWPDTFSANVSTLMITDWALDFNATTGAVNSIWATFSLPVVGDTHGYTARLSPAGVVQQVYDFPYTVVKSYAWNSMSSMDGNYYAYNRYTAQGLMMMPRGGSAWSRMLGDGTTKAVSADGATANVSPVVADTIFIDRFSNIYFVERGIIRVVKNGKIYSLYGISKDSADGTSLLSIRLNQATSLDAGSGNRVITYDYRNNKLTEFRPGESPSTRLLAGNGNSNDIANGTAGPGNPLTLGPWNLELPFASDPATGDVFRGCGDGNVSRICRLDNATRTWYWLPTNTAGTNWGESSSDFLSNFTFSYTALVGGFATHGAVKKLLVTGHQFIPAWNSQLIATKEVTDPYGAPYATHMIGASGPQRATGDFVDGVTAASQNQRTLGLLEMPRPQYDTSDDQWIIAEQSGLAPLPGDVRTILHKVKPGGVFQPYVTLDHLALNYYSYGGFVYSCDISGTLYKTQISNGTKTQLSQPAGLRCTGKSMIMKPAAGGLPARLVFAVSSNGAQGLGEYKLP